MGLLGFRELKTKLERFCAYQERSPFEVKKKLSSLTIDSTQISEIIASLKDDGFLNTERFVEAYVQGKVNQKRWGKQKIKAGLFQHHIPADIIEKNINEISLETYRSNMADLAEKKAKLFNKELSVYDKRSKLMRYLSSKGYNSTDWEGLDFNRLFST